jgi:hypothetical protein
MGGMWTPQGPRQPCDWRCRTASFAVILAVIATFAYAAHACGGPVP